MADCISYRNTNYFSELLLDYLEEKENLREFYSQFPLLENFKKQVETKQNSFTLEHRKVLVKSLQLQYENVEVSEATQENIQSLTEENTISQSEQLKMMGSVTTSVVSGSLQLEVPPEIRTKSNSSACFRIFSR